MRPTSSYILTYAVSLQRLYITGKKDAGATDYTLNATKVAAGIAAATFKQDCIAYTTTQLITVLNDYDPVVRNDAAKELATRTLTPTEVNTLITMAGASDANGRMGACQTLGILKTSLPAVQRTTSRSLFRPQVAKASSVSRSASNWFTPWPSLAKSI